METILLKILEVQNEILAELRLLRQAVSHDTPLTAASPPAQPGPAIDPTPASPDPFVPPPPPQHPGGRLGTKNRRQVRLGDSLSGRNL